MKNQLYFDAAQISHAALLGEVWARCPRFARLSILVGLRGSHVHGTYIPPDDPKGTDDTDVFSVYVRDNAYYHGVSGYLREDDTFTSAGETLDIEAHELRKFVWLLCKGNPNVQQHLWLPREQYLHVSPAGENLIAWRKHFLSQRVLKAFTGYAFGQLERMQKFAKEGYMGEKRARLVQEHGYDTKNAAHCVRLLYTGIHLAQTGELVVRLPQGEQLHDVISIKRGERSFEDVQRLARKLFEWFQRVAGKSVLQEEVDRESTDCITAQTLSMARGEKTS